MSDDSTIAKSFDSPRKPTGFAAMSPERRREIASKGGKTAWQKGTAHRFDSAAASEAGKRAQANGRCHRFEPGEKAREAGIKGAAVKKRRAQEKRQGQV